MKVRIAVAIDDAEGIWVAYGSARGTPPECADLAASHIAAVGLGPQHIVWVEADIPEPDVVQGEVVE